MCKIGDVVQLKSGGPLMTVSSSDSSHSFVKWFEGCTLHEGKIAHGAMTVAQAKS
jgi:uncharacterized protein YodC (DUF2158 family)